MQMTKFCSAVLLAVLVGCAHHPKVENPIQPLEPSDFARDQTARRAILASVSAKLKMGYEGKKQSVSGKGRLVGNYPGNFRLELRDPLGRLHFVFTQKGENAVAYYPRNKQAARETTSGKTYFKRVIGLGLAFSDLVSVSAGVLPASWQRVPLKSWEWDRSEGAFRGVLEKGGEKMAIWVDSANTAIQRMEWQVDGQTVEVAFEDREPCCESKAVFTLGYEVKWNIPDQSTSVQVSWESLLKPNQEIPSSAFEFQPAPGDKVVDLK